MNFLLFVNATLLMHNNLTTPLNLLTTGKEEEGIGLVEDSLGGTETVGFLISQISQRNSYW